MAGCEGREGEGSEGEGREAPPQRGVIGAVGASRFARLARARGTDGGATVGVGACAEAAATIALPALFAASIGASSSGGSGRA
jgi:hypothetical protein